MMKTETMRRQSTMHSDATTNETRGSPHLHTDDHGAGTGAATGRRKSILPPVGGVHRQSIKPSMLAGAKGKKGALGTKVTEDREKSANPPPPNLEPTYRMGPNRKFFAPQVHTLLKQILENHLDGFVFNPKFTPTMTKVLSDEIKERCKAMDFERYKLVVSVMLGERRDQGIMISSRAAWDAKLDSYATYTYQNKSLFCTASVYGVYAE